MEIKINMQRVSTFFRGDIDEEDDGDGDGGGDGDVDVGDGGKGEINVSSKTAVSTRPIPLGGRLYYQYTIVEIQFLHFVWLNHIL
ncbi:unnamed protein product [Enterobius vermicularis]|uniref:Uncharacterized protein n=1 Tax=Enterobius vermicularis TaxID=51028 RepID=A0A0N4VMM2_ENTVE|nr:unnamed protein product [Enterobius vermicularis]